MLGTLIYTSSRNGLFPGNTGFSTVGCNREMNLATRQKLEQLSGYSPLYPHYDPRSAQNPENYCHRVVGIGGKPVHVLSRICFNGMDYTQRSNKLASHLVLSPEEMGRFPGGPGELFQDTTLFKEPSWPIHAEYLPYPQPKEGTAPARCSCWHTLTGDAGWAGAVLERLLQAPQKTFYFLFAPEKHALNLSLLREILQLAPPSFRWNLTFSTYFTENVTDCECRLRFCPPGSPFLELAKGRPESNEVLDLREKLPAAQGGDYVVFARTGKWPQGPSAPAPVAGLRKPPQPPPFAPRPMAPLPPPPPPMPFPPHPGMGTGGVKYSYCLVILLLCLFTLGLYVREMYARKQGEKELQRQERIIQDLWMRQKELLETMEKAQWEKMPIHLVALWEQAALGMLAQEKMEKGVASQEPGKDKESPEEEERIAQQEKECIALGDKILDDIRKAIPGTVGKEETPVNVDLSYGVAKDLVEKEEAHLALKVEDKEDISWTIDSVKWDGNDLGAGEGEWKVNIGDSWGALILEATGRFLIFRLEAGNATSPNRQKNDWEGLQKEMEQKGLTITLKRSDEKTHEIQFQSAPPQKSDKGKPSSSVSPTGTWRWIGWELPEGDEKASPVAVLSWSHEEGVKEDPTVMIGESPEGIQAEIRENEVEIRISCLKTEWEKFCRETGKGEEKKWESFRENKFHGWVSTEKKQLAEKYPPKSKKTEKKEELANSSEEGKDNAEVSQSEEQGKEEDEETLSDTEGKAEEPEHDPHSLQQELNALRKRLWTTVPLKKLKNEKGWKFPEGLTWDLEEEKLPCQKILERRQKGILPSAQRERFLEEKRSKLEKQWKGKLKLQFPSSEEPSREVVFPGFEEK